jgi:hypothetical protein
MTASVASFHSLVSSVRSPIYTSHSLTNENMCNDAFDQSENLVAGVNLDVVRVQQLCTPGATGDIHQWLQYEIAALSTFIL